MTSDESGGARVGPVLRLLAEAAVAVLTAALALWRSSNGPPPTGPTSAA